MSTHYASLDTTSGFITRLTWYSSLFIRYICDCWYQLNISVYQIIFIIRSKNLISYVVWLNEVCIYIYTSDLIWMFLSLIKSLYIPSRGWKLGTIYQNLKFINIIHTIYLGGHQTGKDENHLTNNPEVETKCGLWEFVMLKGIINWPVQGRAKQSPEVH